MNGSYPATYTPGTPFNSTSLVRGTSPPSSYANTDANCKNSSGTQVGNPTAQWIPGLSDPLPQSDNGIKGVAGNRGCYMYTSDGTWFVLSAWNMAGSPQTGTYYRRLGFRETTMTGANSEYVFCNHGTIGGSTTSYTTYNIANDYYKYSYTISNLPPSICDETPPPGA